MDLELRTIDGQRVPFLIAAGHAVLFYLLDAVSSNSFLVCLIRRREEMDARYPRGMVMTRRPISGIESRGGSRFHGKFLHKLQGDQRIESEFTGENGRSLRGTGEYFI